MTIPSDFAAYPEAYPHTGILMITGDGNPGGLYTARFPDGRIVHGDMRQDPGPYIERRLDGRVLYSDSRQA